MDTLIAAIDFGAVIPALLSVGAVVIGVSVMVSGIRIVLRVTRLPQNEPWDKFKERVRREHGWDV